MGVERSKRRLQEGKSQSRGRERVEMRRWDGKMRRGGRWLIWGGDEIYKRSEGRGDVIVRRSNGNLGRDRNETGGWEGGQDD